MSLPKAGEPLKLEDGSLLMPDGTVQRPQEEYIEVPTNRAAVKEITAVRRRVSELPDVPEKMNVVSVVLAYHLFGLPDREIGIATGLSEEQVGRIRMLDAFSSMMETVTESIAKQDMEDVRAMIEQNARNAVRKVSDLMNADAEAVQLSAAKDILDRAGHRPADVVEHRHKMEGGLHIVIERRDQSESVPGMTFNGEVIEDAGD